MVIETNVTGIYVHAAYATDDKGTDFSLTSFPEAVYIGNYMDRSATESTDPNMYKWKPLYSDNVNPSDIEDDSEAYESVDVANVQDAVGVVSDAAAMLKVRTDYNEDNLEKTQSTQDEGLGNLNLLVGTNQGDSNWTAGSATIASVTDPVYSDDPNDDIETVQFTLTSATDTFTFDSGNLLDYIAANDEEENTYTLSYDIKVSNTSATMVPSVPSILTFESPEFTDDPDDDFSDTWLHFASTAVISSTSGTDFQFTYSGSAADTVQIANLKIEAGALATPWRASLDEVEGIANTALSTASTAASDASIALGAANAVAEHFWTDASGAHITEVTQTQYQSDPPNAGGNTLINSTGMTIYDGTTALASFGSTGAVIGQIANNEYRFEISSSNLKMINRVGGNDVTIALISEFFTFGSRNAGSAGNRSFSEGAMNIASGDYSYAGGFASTASGDYSYARGDAVEAAGDFAHAQNQGTKASSDNQTAIGIYNVEDNADTYAFIIGNGTANNARSNALTVAWNGDTTTAGDVSAVDGNFSGDVSADNVTITTDLTVGGDSTVTGDVAAGSVTTTGTVTAADIAATTAAITSNLTAGGDITATGDLAGADATLTGTMTVGRAPTSNLEVATKKYVDDNSGGGGFAGTATIIKTSATLTSTATDYTLSDSIANYKFLTFVFSNNTNYGRWTVPVSIFNLSTTAMENVVTRGGSTTRYAYIKYVNNTKINAYCSVNNGLNMVVYGIK